MVGRMPCDQEQQQAAHVCTKPEVNESDVCETEQGSCDLDCLRRTHSNEKVIHGVGLAVYRMQLTSKADAWSSLC